MFDVANICSMVVAMWLPLPIRFSWHQGSSPILSLASEKSIRMFRCMVISNLQILRRKYRFYALSQSVHVSLPCISTSISIHPLQLLNNDIVSVGRLIVWSFDCTELECVWQNVYTNVGWNASAFSISAEYLRVKWQLQRACMSIGIYTLNSYANLAPSIVFAYPKL